MYYSSKYFDALFSSLTYTDVAVCKLFVFTVIQSVTLEEHSVECVTSGERQLLPAVTSSGVVKLMSFAAFNAASVKSKVRTFL